jgi:hypothetical protein
MKNAKKMQFICLGVVFFLTYTLMDAPTLVSNIGWISITTIYPKIYDRLLITKPKVTRITHENNCFLKKIQVQVIGKY